ncbi:MAG: GGDEF domain-containing protein [bacterium]|nr:GGDEF domain-containing protein [bacterium]
MINSVGGVNFSAAQNLNYPVAKPVYTTQPMVTNKPYKEEKGKGNSSAIALIGCGIAGASTIALLKNKANIDKIVKNALKEVGIDGTGKTISENISTLKEQAIKDGMTKLYNKASLENQVIAQYSEAKAAGKPFSVAILDMDNFKSINEVLGHDKGDLFLKEISKQIIEVAEKNGEKAYRFGGEELVLTSVGKSKDEFSAMLTEIAERIKKDDALQSNLETFKTKMAEQKEPISEQLKLIQNGVFDELKNNKNQNVAKENISKFLDNYQKDFEPQDVSLLNEIKKLVSSDSKISLSTDVAGQPLKIQLDKFVTPYKNTLHDIEKWSSHVEKTNAFTVSGGYVTIPANATAKFTTSDQLVKAADLSLQDAKLGGKNQILEGPASYLEKATA